MPFRIDQTPSGKFKLFNLHKKKYTKQLFLTKQSAINSGKNSMRYRHECGFVKGNFILKKNICYK